MPRLYCGRLNQRVTERDVKRFFDGYGKIRDIMMKNGYAFLDFDDYRDADDAVYDLNGKELMGDRVILEHAKGVERGSGGAPNRDRGGSDRERGGGYSSSRDRGGDRDRDRDSGFGGPNIAQRKQRAREKYGPPIRTKWQVRIENVSSRVSWQDLKDYCRPYADVTYADAHRKEKGVACVCVSSYDDLKTLLRKLDNVELNGKRVKVIDESGSRSRSRSRSRGKYRSRSRSRSRSYSRSRSRSRSKGRRSKSPAAKRSRSPAAKRSRSPARRSKSRSKSRSRSRSRSRSASPKKHARSRSHSRSRSRSKSRSASP